MYPGDKDKNYSDPRDTWDRARRMEIFRYAQEKGVSAIKDGPSGLPPKDVMVAQLKALGLPPPLVNPRLVGAYADSRSGDTSPNSHHYTGQQTQQPAETVELDALAVLERDWKQQQSAPVAVTITELRKECKRRGIKMARTDNLTTLKAKLNG